MNEEIEAILHGYIDETLSESQWDRLNVWLKEDPDHALELVKIALMHDHLRNTITSLDEPSEGEILSLPIVPTKTNERTQKASPPSNRFWWFAAGVTLLSLGLGWIAIGQSTAIAAARELDRIIASSLRSTDREYEIIVEHASAPPRRNSIPDPTDNGRPVKPSLANARLFVREKNQFVLIRYAENGSEFITGSNGIMSWAVKEQGTVRQSYDLSRFSRDLPGHETSIPLTNIYEGLEHLKQSYTIQVSPLGPEEYDNSDSKQYRMLVAIKRPKVRGPQRVEIAYEASSGSILHFRFVQMPYGPQRLDLRLTLKNESPLSKEFFDHESHHAPNRNVETE